MSSLVEQHTDVLIGELVTKAIFVGVVYPFSHPNEGFGLREAWWVS